MEGFAVYYILVNIVCVIVFGILLFHNHFSIDRQEKQIKFDHALIASMCYFVTDIFWAAIVSGMVPKTLYTVVINTFLIYLFMVAITYTWLQYVLAVLQMPHRNRRINRFAMIFPFLIST
ncbi:MAG: hypothetical protein IJT77_13115, partial [Clostridia bacterium]|nr:hypothetical protein [Clostridia bacterium]